MAAIDIITRYFPQLTPEQIEHFTQLDALYRNWNAKINVISRKDIDALYEHHILHSLGIAQMIRFKPGTHILDFGTGGGFPGIPLAILFPECEFLLVDSIGKKVKVAAAVAEALGLKNVRTLHGRGEDVKEQFDFIVSRAVMRLDELVGADDAMVDVRGWDDGEERVAVTVGAEEVFAAFVGGQGIACHVSVEGAEVVEVGLEEVGRDVAASRFLEHLQRFLIHARDGECAGTVEPGVDTESRFGESGQ